MNHIINIFKTFFIAIIKIIGFSFIFIVQLIWYAIYRRKDKFGDAFGDFGRSITETVVDVLKSL